MITVGIYSFPRSGNMWVRSIIAGLFDGNLAALPELHTQSLDTAESCNGYRFFKHHGFKPLTTWNGQDIDDGHCIHIRRNPLDVFISYMNFRSKNVMATASIPYDTVESIVGTDLFDMYFHTFVLTGHLSIGAFSAVSGGYFKHNQDWMARGRDMPDVKCIRYEDLLADPMTTMGFLQDWLQISEDQLQTMLARAKAMTAQAGRLFWKGKEKNYHNFLTEDQIRLFLKYRGAQSAALGYDAEYLLAD